MRKFDFDIVWTWTLVRSLLIFDKQNERGKSSFSRQEPLSRTYFGMSESAFLMLSCLKSMTTMIILP